MKLDLDILTPFAPNPDALLDRLRPMVSDNILYWIASLDYGRDVEQHFAALAALRDGAEPAGRLGWHPMEVLDLGIGGPPLPCYLSEKHLDLRDNAERILHAFILACQLRASPQGLSVHQDVVYVAASRLLASAHHVPEITDTDIARVFAWLLTIMPNDEDCPFLVIWLVEASLNRRLDAPTETIASMATWAHHVETDPVAISQRMERLFQRDLTFAVWGEIGNRLMHATDLGDLDLETQQRLSDVSRMLMAS